MKKILIINGHGNPEASVANKKILEAVAKAIPEAEIATLAELYPDRNFNVELEQRRLSEADVIVFEYPIWWYSHPSILHKYLEDVFQHGFAYGHTKKLAGKKLICSFTCGAPEKNYLPGASGEDIEKLALPIKATCWLCAIDYVGTVGTYGAMYFNLTEEEAIDVDAKIAQHAQRLIDLINKEINND